MIFSVELMSVLSQVPSSTWAPSVPHAWRNEAPPTASVDSPTPRSTDRRLIPGTTSPLVVRPHPDLVDMFPPLRSRTRTFGIVPRPPPSNKESDGFFICSQRIPSSQGVNG